MKISGTQKSRGSRGQCNMHNMAEQILKPLGQDFIFCINWNHDIVSVTRRLCDITIKAERRADDNRGIRTLPDAMPERRGRGHPL